MSEWLALGRVDIQQGPVCRTILRRHVDADVTVCARTFIVLEPEPRPLPSAVRLVFEQLARIVREYLERRAERRHGPTQSVLTRVRSWERLP